MNNRRHNIPHPALLYFILLLLVILASWIGTVYQLRVMGQNSHLSLRSLLDTMGIRWMIRHFPMSIAQAPVGNALLLFSGLGLLNGSGLSNAIGRSVHRSGLSYKERMGLRLSYVVITICLILFFMGLFSGQRILLGITGSLLTGPVPDGAIFLLFTPVALASAVFGYTSDRFRNGDDFIDAMVSLIPRYASFFIALLIASQILTVFEYSGLNDLLNLSSIVWCWIEFILWWLPLPLLYLRQKGRSSHF